MCSNKITFEDILDEKFNKIYQTRVVKNLKLGRGMHMDEVNP